MANKQTITIELNAEISQFTNALTTLQGKLSQLGSGQTTKGLNSELTHITQIVNRLQNASGRQATIPLLNNMEDQVVDINKALLGMQQRINSIQAMNSRQKLELFDPNTLSILDQAKARLNEYEKTKDKLIDQDQKVVQALEEQAKIQKELSNLKGQRTKKINNNPSADITDLDDKINETEIRLSAAEANVKAQRSSAETTIFGQVLNDVQNLSPILANVTGNLQEARNQIDSTTDALANQAVSANVQPMVDQINNLSQANTVVQQRIDDTRNSLEVENEQFAKVDGIVNRAQALFNLTTAYRLLRSVVRDAFETIKELDATMTEAAVVTNFDVGDMWDQLPEYTERAQELGLAINDVYESATLFYQQGLKTDQVIELSNATLKMARIAGLDATDATDRMTNALRGFNMELNETNATNVADVYSKLAAITASDVDEISTAMTKVASLANSANMTFENTAAFLSQIIETTRESAETAGTALKTVVARFAEVKSTPTGSVEVEGEAASYNNIDKALRSVGISLDAFMKGEEGLDEVLMKLAEKWDTLSTSTQRYIATQAAGSRQQSRFIALMSDYARTQELVAAANNAAGASATQYAKTLDSLETKLNQLQDSWDQFTLSIANSDLIKGAVDLLNTLLSTINSIDSGIIKLGSSMAIFLTASTALNGAVKGFKTLRKYLEAGKDIENFDFSSLENGATIIQNIKTYAKAMKSGVKGAFKALAEGAKTALVPLLEIAAAVGTIVIVVHAIKMNTLKHELESVTAALGDAQTAMTDANDALSSLSDKFASFNTAYDDINKLQEGTVEWTLAVQELNTEILELAQNYKDIQISMNDKGVMYLDENAQESIVEQATARSKASTIDYYLASDQYVMTNYYSERKSLAKESDNGRASKSIANKLINGEITADEAYSIYKGYDESVVDAAIKIANAATKAQASLDSNTEALTKATFSSDERLEGQNSEAILGELNNIQNDQFEEWWRNQAGIFQYDSAWGDQVWQQYGSYLQSVNPNATKINKNAWNGTYEVKDAEGNILQTFQHVEEIAKGYYLSTYDLTDAALQEIIDKVNTYGSYINWEGLDYDIDERGVDWLDSLIDNFAIQVGKITRGEATSFSDFGLGYNEFQSAQGLTLSSEAPQEVQDAWNQYLTNGIEASKIMDNVIDFSGLLSDDEQLDTIWNSLMNGIQRHIEQGVDSWQSSDFADLTLQEIEVLIKSFSAAGMDAAATAASEAVEVRREQIETSRKNYGIGKNETATQFQSYTANKDKSDYNKYYTNTAESMLKDSTSEMKESEVNMVADALARASVTGTDFADAVQDYNEAIAAGKYADTTDSLKEMADQMTNLIGWNIDADAIMDPEILTLLTNATNSIEDFMAAKYAVAEQTLTTTGITQEEANAMATLADTFGVVEGGVVTSGVEFEVFRTAIQNSATDCDTLTEAAMGMGLALKFGTDGLLESVTSARDTLAEAFKSVYTPKSTSSSKWENPLEYQYDLLKKINAEQRKLNRLENSYEIMTANASGNIELMTSLLKQQTESYSTQYEEQQQLANNYEARLKELNSTYEDIKDYISYNFEEGRITVDWGKWEALDNKKSSDDTFVKRLESAQEDFEEASDGFDEANDSLDSIKSDTAKIRQQARQDYIDVISEVAEMLEQQKQDELDALQEQLDAERDANDDLISAVESNISKLRQDRENEESEKNIQDLTKRIAYLKQDTSGSNALLIKQLEEELEDATTDYEDELIDQSLEDLKDSQEAAYDQRQQQIDNQQSMIDWMSEYGKYNDEAQKTIEDSLIDMKNNGVGISETALGKLFSSTHTDYTPAQLESDLGELVDKISNVNANDSWRFDTETSSEFKSLINDVSSINGATASINAINAAAQSKEVSEDEFRDIIWSRLGLNDSDLNNGVKDFSYVAQNTNDDYIKQVATGTSKAIQQYYWNKTEETPTPTVTETVEETPTTPRVGSTVTVKEGTKKFGSLSNSAYMSKSAMIGPEMTVEKIQDNQALLKKGSTYMGWVDLSNLDLVKYATGGLNTSTGLAWLDGTASKPELVLNSTDTENFIQLKDILRNLLSHNSSTSTNTGDYSFDIDINVDEIGSDYDVDQLASRVKQDIVSAMTYRNNNFASLLR